jgi:hypothetical protein
VNVSRSSSANKKYINVEPKTKVNKNLSTLLSKDIDEIQQFERDITNQEISVSSKDNNETESGVTKIRSYRPVSQSKIKS